MIRATVVDQVELDVAAAAHQLETTLLVGPRPVHVPAHQAGIGLQERLADVAGEGEVRLPVAAVEVVVEDAAAVSLPAGLHFVTARRRIREALSKDGVAPAIDRLAEKLLG